MDQIKWIKMDQMKGDRFICIKNEQINEMVNKRPKKVRSSMDP